MATEPSTAILESGQHSDRVRSHTSSSVNEKIDQKMIAQVKSYASRSHEDITQRIHELETEWDTERVLEANASVLAW